MQNCWGSSDLNGYRLHPDTHHYLDYEHQIAGRLDYGLYPIMSPPFCYRFQILVKAISPSSSSLTS